MTSTEDSKLPDLPVLTVIEPSAGIGMPSIGDLWQYRELIYFLIWRDLKVRYKQTAVGALWAILQPVGLTLVFTIFLGRIQGISPEGVPYAAFALAGFVPWTLFSQALSRSSDSLVQSTNLIQKVYFPRLILPISSVGSPLVDYAIGLVVLIGALLLMGYVPSLAIIWIVPLTVLAVGVALAVGIWLSAINVRYRDVRHIVPFLIQVWLFATPVVYSATLVPADLRWAYFLNPMAGVVVGFRWALVGEGAPPTEPMLISIVVTGVVLVTGLAYFRRVSREFADVI